ncbi:unnamed protein product, partial [Protopolystoma xenopodis]
MRVHQAFSMPATTCLIDPRLVFAGASATNLSASLHHHLDIQPSDSAASTMSTSSTPPSPPTTTPDNTLTNDLVATVAMATANEVNAETVSEVGSSGRADLAPDIVRLATGRLEPPSCVYRVETYYTGACNSCPSSPGAGLSSLQAHFSPPLQPAYATVAAQAASERHPSLEPVSSHRYPPGLPPHPHPHAPLPPHPLAQQHQHQHQHQHQQPQPHQQQNTLVHHQQMHLNHHSHQLHHNHHHHQQQQHQQHQQQHEACDERRPEKVDLLVGGEVFA